MTNTCGNFVPGKSTDGTGFEDRLGLNNIPGSWNICMATETSHVVTSVYSDFKAFVYLIACLAVIFVSRITSTCLVFFFMKTSSDMQP